MKTVYWFGYGGNSVLVDKLRPIIENVGLKLVTISEWKNADIKWERLTWLNELRKADIIVIPANYKEQPAKSCNRLTQSLSLGKPVICSPLDSYLRVLKEFPDCCLIADSDEEWEEKLVQLRDNQELCQKLSIEGLKASQKYSINEITKKWILLFNNLQKTDIIIPTYNNLPCLKLCIESIKACTTSLYNIIVVDNGSNTDVQKYLESQADIIYIKKDRMNFAQAVNTGLKVSSSKYVCILNDDVIVSKNWLEKMIEVCKDNIGAVGPLSNCDKGFTHQYDITVGDLSLKPGIHVLSEINPIIQDIYNYISPYNQIREQSWVAFYCTLIPKEVVDKVGLLDEQSFSNSGEDVDYNYRITKQGYKIIQNLNSFVFHFGAVGRHIVEKEDPRKYHELDDKNRVNLNDKWSKKTIVLFSGISCEKWDHRSLETGIGGSEIWQIYLSREFDKLGYRVINFNDCAEDCKDGNIQYIHCSKFPEFVKYNWVDYFISSRTEDPFQYNIRSGKNFIISHDVWLLSGQQIKYTDKVDKYLCLSDWHKTFFSQHHSIPLEKIHITSNGIDFKRFDDVKVERNPYRLHWSSSWDRGLDNVLYLWPFIKQQIPEAELHCYYGIFNWKQSCLQKNDQEGLKKIADLEEKVKQPGIFTYGRVSQKELAIEISKASLLLYPSWFSETFWITSIECQYAGVPVICNKYAGAITTLKDSAIMLGDGSAWWPYTKEGREQFLAETVSILKDRNKWKEWSERGRENAKNYSWENVAKNWVDQILK